VEKAYAIIFSLLITGLIASNIYLLSFEDKTKERETVIISKILDGDTLDLGDGRRIRLLNINAPEKNQPLSELSTNFLKDYENETVEIEVTGVEKYGRLLARIYGDKYLNLELVRLGLVHKYIVEDSELNLYEKAESDALKKQSGIWKTSEYNGCLKIEINKKDELLTIDNLCEIDFKNLALKDESTKTSKFDIFGNQHLVIHSGKGQDLKDELYLNSPRNIWNDDKDSIFIRDESGLLLYYDSYGY